MSVRILRRTAITAVLLATVMSSCGGQGGSSSPIMQAGSAGQGGQSSAGQQNPPPSNEFDLGQCPGWDFAVPARNCPLMEGGHFWLRAEPSFSARIVGEFPFNSMSGIGYVCREGHTWEHDIPSPDGVEGWTVYSSAPGVQDANGRWSCPVMK